MSLRDEIESYFQSLKPQMGDAEIVDEIEQAVLRRVDKHEKDAFEKLKIAALPSGKKPRDYRLRDEIIQRICDEKYRLCGHIPPLHEGGCKVCGLSLAAQCEIVALFKMLDQPKAEPAPHSEQSDERCNCGGVGDPHIHSLKFKPSDERPARNALEKLASNVCDANGKLVETHDKAWRAVSTRAIVEAIDAGFVRIERALARNNGR